uniref:AP2/ERF domain-containing protein n=1 Tax=Setaria viridis TaxID=4556 RepID=A0A4U6V1P6_SETVI|nr:hypothetical protein SEVIR_4G216001v2 [Setaria viridis]
MPGPGRVVELARQAAAAARADGRAAREAAVLPATRYRGVQMRGRRYAATLWNPFLKKAIRLGSYGTAVEAAYAYDAAARSVLGRWARPNFPELSAAPAAREVIAADLARARRAAEPARQQQQAPRRQAPLIRCWVPAPAGAAAQHQERVAPPVFAFRREAAPQYMRLHYRPGSAATGGGLYAVAFVPGVPDLNDPVPDTSSSELSSTESGSAPAAPNRRELPHLPALAVEPDQSMEYVTTPSGGTPTTPARLIAISIATTACYPTPWIFL